MSERDDTQALNAGTFGGIILMSAALTALAIANSPLAASYFGALHAYIGPLSILHWVNDALMAVFFLLVGLEIKREFIEGQLSTWEARVLPSLGALGGMIVPAIVYLAITSGHSELQRGWAIPAATDIAFALGVLALLGSKAPLSLKVFLTALAIIDDLGAVLIIAVFYAGGLSLFHLAGAAIVVAALAALNRMGVKSLWPYLALGVALWILVLGSGIHATIAGVLLAITIPIKAKTSQAESPLHKLEHALSKPVALFILPVFAFANAGVSFSGISLETLAAPVPLGIATALAFGKLIGVFGVSFIVIALGRAKLPAGANWTQMLGVSLLCGIGFTMSLFIGSLAFVEPAIQDEVKLGILLGSLVAGIAGYIVLALAPQGPRRVS